MVTGDHPTTARAIAKRVSILQEPQKQAAADLDSFQVPGSKACNKGTCLCRDRWNVGDRDATHPFSGSDAKEMTR